MLGCEPQRRVGLARLRDFVPRAGRAYAEHRNDDHGPDDRENVSGLSPYIRYRLVSEAEVVQTVLAEHSFEAAEKFIQEVLWRTYWKGWLELRPQVWEQYVDAVRRGHQQVAEDADLARRYEQAMTGQTGIECYDAWLEERIATGYLHNHARMWVASIWIFTLRLPWALGAELFYRYLLDGDPASNTLSWRWVAGLQTRGKHYLARASNIRTYTQGRFYPAGQLDEQAWPLPDATSVASGRYDAGDPVPTCTERYGLLVFPDDVSPEQSELKTQHFQAAAGFASSAVGSRYRFAPAVRQFVDAAMGDCQSRVAAHFQTDMTVLSGRDPVAACAQWCQQQGLQGLVTLKPTQGPWAELCADVEMALRETGHPFIQCRRQWDQTFHPHATKGFFAFKRQIPHHLDLLLNAPTRA